MATKMKPIKVSEETYRDLVRLAGKLQMEAGEPVSIESAIKYLLKSRISHLAGSWEMDDEEAEKIFGELREAWKRWKK
jgi:predicted CopG family antitoxin